ncbi:hypothetical protein NECID01_1811 [Nematocida sp. AWRm77]|nr:hypothetical protein NECID01_1811 [Nematocida sp. AWRm77]
MDLNTYIEVSSANYSAVERSSGEPKPVEWKNVIVTDRTSLGTDKNNSARGSAISSGAQEGSEVHEGVFRKVCLEGVGTHTTPKEVYAAGSRHDLVEVFVSSNALLEKCAGWKITSVLLDLGSESLKLRKGTVSKAVHAHIYFTLDMSPYFYPHTRRAWIHNTRELLRLASKKSIVLSLGSKSSVSKEEVVSILKKFHLKEKTISKFFTTNTESMLLRTAVKKYAYAGMFVQVQEKESSLKAMVYKATKQIPNLK